MGVYEMMWLFISFTGTLSVESTASAFVEEVDPVVCMLIIFVAEKK
jgi:hypothetical protein